MKSIPTVSDLKEEKPKVGAFVEEIRSNQDIVGNMNSQHMYNQTKDENNGMCKEANRYLEKIAVSKFVKEFPGRLATEIKNAPALNQLGMAGGVAFGAGKLTSAISSAISNKKSKDLDEESLKALHGINKTLNTAVIIPNDNKYIKKIK